MKALELTKEHKSKLLEMCKALFPEWKAHSLITDENYISDDTGEFSESDETFKIHWFEFCIVYITKKLIYPGNKLMKLHIGLLTTQDIHPVDYLYEQFKQLKT